MRGFVNEHAPGWYEHDGERRYWDGTQWTHSTSLPSSATPSQPFPQGPGQQLLPPSTPAGSPPQGSVPPPTYGAMPPANYAPSPYGAPGGPQPGAIPVPRKEPAVSLLVSFLIPGVGSMINGDVGAGVAFLGFYLLGLVLVICLGWLIIGLIGVPVMLGAWIWSMIHAFQGAQMYNRSVGYPG